MKFQSIFALALVIIGGLVAAASLTGDGSSYSFNNDEEATLEALGAWGTAQVSGFTTNDSSDLPTVPSAAPSIDDLVTPRILSPLEGAETLVDITEGAQVIEGWSTLGGAVGHFLLSGDESPLFEVSAENMPAVEGYRLIVWFSNPETRTNQPLGEMQSLGNDNWYFQRSLPQKPSGEVLLSVSLESSDDELSLSRPIIQGVLK